MRVWIDIDNAPHVQLFRPIISRLGELGADVEITARDRTFVPQLLDASGLEHVVIGRGQPGSSMTKAAALTTRVISLARHANRRRFNVAMGHGSRSLPPAARLARVPNLTMFDYEHISTFLYRRFCDRILVPRGVLRSLNGSAIGGRWVPFDGFKEEIYLADFQADASVRLRLGVRVHETLAVVRPPSRTAHYHDRRSEAIERALIDRLASADHVRTVWLRRDPGDPVPRTARTPTFIVPDTPLDGPSLLAAADLAVSGGGTMNREAALLGTPAYSMFTGPPGYLDQELIRQGRLVALRDPSDVQTIPLTRKPAAAQTRPDTRLLDFVVDQIQDLARRGSARRQAPALRGRTHRKEQP